MNIREMYLNGEYLRNNPSWDREDAPWKAALIYQMVQKHNLGPASICEVGCGSGEILCNLEKMLPGPIDFTGWEIAPDAYEICRKRPDNSIHFRLGNFTEDDERTYDLILLIDLIEHLEDCFSFLRTVKTRGRYTILHVPLEMYVLSVLYQQFLLGQWKRVGHLHFFSKDIVLQILTDTGFEVIDYTYTAGFTLLRDYGIKDKLLKVPRKLFFPLSQDLTAKVFGGYSLLVLVK